MTAPIRRSPIIRFSLNEHKQVESQEERIPFPYCYTEIIMSAEDKAAYRQRFLHECNMRRWHHVYNTFAPQAKK